MYDGPNRRDILLGAFSAPQDTAIRPPGAAPARFAQDCTGCGACVEACPTQIVRIGEGRLAELDFNQGECTFCEACVEACEPRALLTERVAEWPWRAEISPTCLSLNGVTCRTCQDVCDPRAISFRLEVGGRARPNIDTEACTGCGACAGSCPASAIAFARSGAPVTSAEEAPA